MTSEELEARVSVLSHELDAAERTLNGIMEALLNDDSLLDDTKEAIRQLYNDY